MTNLGVIELYGKDAQGDDVYRLPNGNLVGAYLSIEAVQKVWDLGEEEGYEPERYERIYGPIEYL